MLRIILDCFYISENRFSNRFQIVFLVCFPSRKQPSSPFYISALDFTISHPPWTAIHNKSRKPKSLSFWIRKPPKTGFLRDYEKFSRLMRRMNKLKCLNWLSWFLGKIKYIPYLRYSRTNDYPILALQSDWLCISTPFGDSTHFVVFWTTSVMCHNNSKPGSFIFKKCHRLACISKEAWSA